MPTHKIYYTDKSGAKKLHDFSGTDADARGWADKFEQEGGHVTSVKVKNPRTGEVVDLHRTNTPW